MTSNGSSGGGQPGARAGLDLQHSHNPPPAYNPPVVWQRNYYEHVIRNDEELNRIREYIMCNLSRWDTDKENPNVVVPEE